MTMEQESQDENTQQPQVITTIKSSIIPGLKELGVTNLTIHYDGSGDEGRLGEITIEPEGISLPDQLEDELRESIDSFLDEQHGTWEDGEGATGTVVLDVPEGKITNEHGVYVTDVEYSTVEF